MTEDFYDLLDIPPDASQDEVKDAYREQVRVYHPDHNDDDRARAQFTAVKKAYDILGDPVERRAYDRLGHETYVAKRTSGLPSPDVWKTKSERSKGSDSSESDADADDSGTTFTYSSEASTSSAAGSTSSKSKAKAAAGASSTTASTSSSTATGTGTGGAAGSSTSSTTNRTADSNPTNGGTARGGARSSAGARSTDTDRFGDNAAVRWWRRQNFSLPLIWLSVVVYLGGLAHFGLENGAALEELSAELTAVGTDPAGIWETLSSSRHGVVSSLEYLAAFELVTPPLEQPLWYGALAGIVGLAVVCLLGARVAHDGEITEPISIDETIVLALALTATTVLVGGPLLAGAVLMPVLFAVIVSHTRRGPGWKPSYLYVLPVLAPAVGFGLAAVGYATLPVDLLAFALLPLVGGLGLPLRATIRKRFGR